MGQTGEFGRFCRVLMLTSLATGAAVRTDDALSINGNRVSGAEKEVKSWAASVTHKEEKQLQ